MMQHRDDRGIVTHNLIDYPTNQTLNVTQEQLDQAGTNEEEVMDLLNSGIDTDFIEDAIICLGIHKEKNG